MPDSDYAGQFLRMFPQVDILCVDCPCTHATIDTYEQPRQVVALMDHLCGVCV
jgi:hypothetical protein